MSYRVAGYRRRLQGVLWIGLVLTAAQAGSAALPYNQNFEDGIVGQMPMPGLNTWDSVVQGANCINRIVASSSIGQGKAVHFVDSSATSGNILLENDDLGTLEALHLSLVFYDAPAATGNFEVIVGRDSENTHFALLQIGAGLITAISPSGNSSTSYTRGTVVTLDIIVNSAASSLSYTTFNSRSGTLPTDRYDVFVNGTLAINDAYPNNHTGTLNAIAFRTLDATTGVDAYLDTIRVYSPTAAPDWPDFTVLASPNYQNASPGGQITYTVTVSPQTNFSSSVTLSTSGLPSGVTSQYSVNPVSPGNWSSQLTVSIPIGMLAGTYSFSVTGTDGSRTRSRSVSFNVLDKVALTTQVNGGNGTMVPTGTNVYDRNTVVPLTATPAAGYRVQAWTGTDNDTSVSNTNNVTMSADKHVTVTFEPLPQYTLNAGVVNGNGTVAPTSGTYVEGTVVTLTTSPACGYRVKAWTGTDNDASTAATNTVTMSANKTVTVEFEPAGQYAFTAGVVGGNGTVSPTCGYYDAGAVIVLTAVPDTGYRVITWTGTDATPATGSSSNTVTVTGDTNVTVEFEPIPVGTFALTTEIAGGNGRIVPVDGYYDAGTVVTLLAMPDAGYHVKSWTGTDYDPSAGNESNTVTMNSDKHVVLEFEPIPEGAFTLTASVVNGHGTIQPIRGVYAPDTVVTLRTTTEDPYQVKAWTGTDDDTLKTANNMVTMNGDKTVTVEFEQYFFHPADVDHSWSITINELTAYGAAWKRGDPWPTEPFVIPIEYVTNAGLIWKTSEVYLYDSTFPMPGSWVPDITNSEPLPPEEEEEPADPQARLMPVTGRKSASAFATRTIRLQSERCEVRIAIEPPASAQAWAVQEQLPAGCEADRIGGDGHYDPGTQSVKWGPYFDTKARTLSYAVCAKQSSGIAGSVAGQLSIDGISDRIAGDSTIEVAATTAAEPVSMIPPCGAGAVPMMTACMATMLVWSQRRKCFLHRNPTELE